MIPGLETRIMDGSDEEVRHVADLVSASGYFFSYEMAPNFASDPERHFERKG